MGVEMTSGECWNDFSSKPDNKT